MTNVIPFNAARKSNFDKASDRPPDHDEEDPGSFIHFVATAEGGSKYSINGMFSNRLQFTVHTLLQAACDLANRIVDSGTAGHTSADPFEHALKPPKRRGQPRRLRGPTGFAPLR